MNGYASTLTMILLMIACTYGSVFAQESTPRLEPSAPAEPRIGVGQAAALGVVEGLTEYLPVSSTGHLILFSHATALSRYEIDPRTNSKKLTKAPALDAFEIVIQIGAILAVLGLYRNHVKRILLGLTGRDPQGLRLLGLLLIAFMPAAIVGLALHDIIKAYLFGPFTVALALALGGILMIVVQIRYNKAKSGDAERLDDLTSMTVTTALIIGIFQCLALFPGMSRSMVTIVGGVLAGLTMVRAAEFSFLLALPTLGAATLYQLVDDWDVLTKNVGWGALLIGILVSGGVAALTVRWLVRWLTSHGLVPFGVYRLALAVAVIGYFLTR